MKKILVLALALCMVMSFAACGGSNSEQGQDNNAGTQQNEQQDANAGENTDTENNEADNQDTNAGTTEEGGETADDGKVTYKVTVVDEAGNPIVGAIVQLCKESCIPGPTNENGVAEFNVVEDEYKVSFTVLPEGYTYSGEEDTFYFESGSYEMTIVLKAAE